MSISLWLTDFATIVTVVLFIFYMIGRIWTGYKESHYKSEHFTILSSKEEKERSNTIDGGWMASIEVVGKYGYEWIKLYRTNVNLETGKEEVSAKEVGKLRYISEGAPFYFKVDLPEVFPRYRVRFKRYDGVGGSFYINDSG